MTLPPSLLAKISLFLILKKLDLQIDPLPPFRKISFLKLFFYGFPYSAAGQANQLQRSPLHCHLSGIFKKVNHVEINMHCLVWRSPLDCPWCGIFKKVYNVGVNMHYLGCHHWRSIGEHANQLQRSTRSAAEVTIALSLGKPSKKKHDNL